MFWATVCSRSCFCWLYRASPSLAANNIIKIDFSVYHLVMSVCRVLSCLVGRGCSLWPVRSPGRTLLAFALLHSVLQGQICLLLQVFLDFLLLHSKCQTKRASHWTLSAHGPASISWEATTFLSICQTVFPLYPHILVVLCLSTDNYHLPGLDRFYAEESSLLDCTFQN